MSDQEIRQYARIGAETRLTQLEAETKRINETFPEIADERRRRTIAANMERARAARGATGAKTGGKKKGGKRRGRPRATTNNTEATQTNE